MRIQLKLTFVPMVVLAFAISVSACESKNSGNVSTIAKHDVDNAVVEVQESAKLFGYLSEFDFKIDAEALRFSKRYARCNLPNMENAIKETLVVLYFDELAGPSIVKFEDNGSSNFSLIFELAQPQGEIVTKIGAEIRRFVDTNPSMPIKDRLVNLAELERESLLDTGVKSRVFVTFCNGERRVQAPMRETLVIRLSRALSSETLSTLSLMTHTKTGLSDE